MGQRPTSDGKFNCCSTDWAKAEPPYRVHLDNIRRKPGPFVDKDAFVPGDEAISSMESMKILLVGPYDEVRPNTDMC